MSGKLTEGWAYLTNSRKWHYFLGGKSLCGKWLYLGSSYEDGGDSSIDNCAKCRSARTALKEKNNG